MKKIIAVRQETHKAVKILAAQCLRKINCDLIDDLIYLGIEEFKKAQKNFKKNVTYEGYNNQP